MPNVQPLATNITCQNLIGGRMTSSEGDRRPVHSPWNGAVIGEVPLSTSTEVKQVIMAASEAAKDWRQTPIKERSQPLFRFRELMLKRLDELSNLVALESGKTVEEARAGVLKGIEVCEFALGLQNLDQGGAMEVSRGVTCQYRREPLGVVVGITPFNFPAMVPLWMYPIALTLGNSFILKPSEKVPLTSQLVAELAVAAGYPAGVFSVINGARETVETLVEHPEVKAIAFVGSTAVARSIYQKATSHGKRCLALGGAKNHLIVVPDADETMTVPGVVNSFTGCAGQRCMAASLMIAVGKVDHLIDKITRKAASLELGRHMGAIIDKSSLERMTSIIDRAERAGAKIILDGRRAQPPASYPNGHWIGPTIIDQADADMECAVTEIFGPVLTIVRTPSLSDAMRLENKNHYGNATSVFTTSGAVARFVSEHATNGMIGVNIGVPVPREPFSFGGTKDSKFGHGDITGGSSMDFWSDLKKITTKWTINPDQNWMS